MGHSPSDLRRTLGSAARLWSGSGRHEVQDEWWLALSGEMNVNYNLACCQSSDTDVLEQRCLQPVLDLRRPGIIMLGGPGLATAQKLVDAGWVSVGALPLMLLSTLPEEEPPSDAVRALRPEDLAPARELLADNYGLDDSSAVAAIPDRALDRHDLGVWGLWEDERMVSVVTIAIEDGLAVVWSMATRPECQGRGHGRRLLASVLREQIDRGATGSLLHSSVAGQALYRGLGYSVVDYLQLWSRPRWVLGSA
jgi:ribosomal protein S18 acetylase RimI-like enzyme